MKRLCVNLPKKTTLPCVIIDLAVLWPHISWPRESLTALVSRSKKNTSCVRCEDRSALVVSTLPPLSAHHVSVDGSEWVDAPCLTTP